MTLINRVSRLLRADLHAILDQVEEPGPLLREAVREMTEDLARDRRRLELLVEEQRALGARREALAASLERMGGELDVCFAAGREDLARTLVRRRLETERLRDLLDRRSGELERDLSRLRERVAANASRLEAMRQKAELLAREEPDGGAAAPWGPPDRTVTDDEVEMVFLREQRRRAGP
jgi:phage shock protein A